MKYLKTSDIARIGGVHPNTVRMYEVWGLLPPIPRKSNGYRQYTEFHADQIQLIRLALHNSYINSAIRKSAYTIVKTSAAGNLEKALELAFRHLELVRSELAQADAAAEALECWAQGAENGSQGEQMKVKDVIRILDVTFDMLRHWERNNLISVPRDPKNGYRLYGRSELDRLRVIRTLTRAQYSTASVLRILTHLDCGYRGDIRQVLDIPASDEDFVSIADRLLTTLTELEEYSVRIISLLDDMVKKYK